MKPHFKPASEPLHPAAIQCLEVYKAALNEKHRVEYNKVVEQLLVELVLRSK